MSRGPERDRTIENLWLPQLAADAAALVSAYMLTLYLRFHSAWGEKLFAVTNRLIGVDIRDLTDFELFYIQGAPRILAELAIPLFVLYALMDLYSSRRFIRPRPAVWNILVSNFIVLGVIYTYFYLRRNVFHPRSMFITILVLNALFCSVYRILLSALLRRLRRGHGIDRHRAVFAGGGADGERVEEYVRRLAPHGIEASAVVRWDAGTAFDDWLARVRETVVKTRARMLICAQTDLSTAQIMRCIRMADELGVATKILSRELDVIRNEARIATDAFRGIPLVHFDGLHMGLKLRRPRHALSRVAALVALTILGLPMLAIAAAIRLTSRGPALFAQDRIGDERQPFRMLKFRTMHSRAEEMQAEIEELNESRGVLFKIRDDPRVTPVGRFLRRFSLDELPQLINVLRGEMTLVGPRPLPMRDFEAYYEEWHYSRHEGLPGLTGIWQVSGRSELDFHRMCILDIYYLHNQNWILDLKLILRSIWVVLFAKGAY
jgi:exopolysaccharide biosynthesis polyprenyl glycosylphosphotransferase